MILRRAGVDRPAREPLPVASLPLVYIDDACADEFRNLCFRAMLICAEYHVAS